MVMNEQINEGMDETHSVLLARLEEIFGSRAKAERWLKEPNQALQMQPPLELLGTDEGTRQVEEVLLRIEHGVFS